MQNAPGYHRGRGLVKQSKANVAGSFCLITTQPLLGRTRLLGLAMYPYGAVHLLNLFFNIMVLTCSQRKSLKKAQFLTEPFTGPRK